MVNNFDSWALKQQNFYKKIYFKIDKITIQTSYFSVIISFPLNSKIFFFNFPCRDFKKNG